MKENSIRIGYIGEKFQIYAYTESSHTVYILLVMYLNEENINLRKLRNNSDLFRYVKPKVFLL